MYARTALLAALALAACTPQSPNGDGDHPDRVARAVTSPDGDIGVVVDGHNAFTFDLHTSLIEVDPTENLFFSPFSITSALGMTRAGARGVTADELRAALRAEGDDADWHAALGALTRDLNGDLKRGYTLRIANRLFGQDGFPFEAPFLGICADDYGAPFASWDFRSDPEGGREHINAWVAEQTEDRIQDLLPPGSVNDGTRLVLANAIYFYADWALQFDPDDTRDADFRRLDGSTVRVPMMTRNLREIEEHGVRVGFRDGVSVLQLPYRDDEVSMIVLVPDAIDGLPALEASLDAARWRALTRDLSLHSGLVGLPRFELRSEADLVPHLRGLGVVDAFDAQAADFTGIAPPVDGNLHITGVFHQAFVKVDERGTEAAAATGVVVGTESASMDVIADRPFVFAIRDDLTGAILFLGRVTDPS
jgi:serpin B